eukprot:Lankesteria_metandrocarpae@DN9479_c0_g1_i1.p1
MSISTVSGQDYNKFYDQGSDSDGGSHDSFIVGQKREKPKKAKAKKTSVSNTASHTGGFVESIFSAMPDCCALRERRRNQNKGDQHDYNTGASLYYDGKGLGALAHLVHGDSDNSDSSSGGTFKDIPRGAKAHTVQATDYDTNKKNKSKKNAEFENVASWKIALSAKFADAREDLEIAQQLYGVMLWCMGNEKSAHMSERMLKQLDNFSRSAALDFDFSRSIQDEGSDLLDIVRHVEVRQIEESLGDLYDAVHSLEGTGGVYSVVSQDSCAVAIYARTQGDVMFVSLYHPGKLQGRRGAAFFGFNKIEDIGEFLAALFSEAATAAAAKKKPSPSGRFQVILLKSKHTYLPNIEERKKAWEETEPETTREVADTADPQQDAKEVYSAMLKASKNPNAEHVFSWAPAGGMHIHTAAEVEREAALRNS